jgi:two-component system response regulator DesR
MTAPEIGLNVRTILIDDSQSTREVLARLVSFAGGRVVASYGSAEEALRALEPADLVILDYQMPGMDGIAAAERIRGQDPHVFLAMITVLDHPVIRDRAGRAGIRAFLGKPVSLAQVGALMSLVHERVSPEHVLAGDELIAWLLEEDA